MFAISPGIFMLTLFDEIEEKENNFGTKYVKTEKSNTYLTDMKSKNVRLIEVSPFLRFES